MWKLPIVNLTLKYRILNKRLDLLTANPVWIAWSQRKGGERHRLIQIKNRIINLKKLPYKLNFGKKKL